MDDQSPNQEPAAEFTPRITSTRRQRRFGGILFLVYLAGWALAVYFDLNHLERHWPARVVGVLFATWVTIMLVLPLVVVCWLAGIDGSPAWMRGRISVRALLIITTLAAVTFGVIVALVE